MHQYCEDNRLPILIHCITIVLSFMRNCQSCRSNSHKTIVIINRYKVVKIEISTMSIVIRHFHPIYLKILLEYLA